MSSIGERIKTARKSAKMTQEQLAEAIEANRVTIAKYEAGNYLPSVPVLLKLADALGVTQEYLSCGADSDTGVSSDPQDEVWQLREQLRRDPERRTLFDAAANVRKEDILTAVRILDALKGDDD